MAPRLIARSSRSPVRWWARHPQGRWDRSRPGKTTETCSSILRSKDLCHSSRVKGAVTSTAPANRATAPGDQAGLAVEADGRPAKAKARTEASAQPCVSEDQSRQRRMGGQMVRTGGV